MTIAEMAVMVESLTAVLEVIPGLVDQHHVKNLERVRKVFSSLVKFKAAR